MVRVNPPVQVQSSTHRGRPGYSRDDVIDAAVREFNQRGYEATSMGHVASVLGGAVSPHFFQGGDFGLGGHPRAGLTGCGG